MSVACGYGFTTVVTEEGDVYACGRGEEGQLGLGILGAPAHKLLLVCVGGREVFDQPVIMMSAKDRHTALITKDGVLWSWSKGKFGQLGHGGRELRWRPGRLGKEIFCGSQPVMVACGCVLVSPVCV